MPLPTDFAPAERDEQSTIEQIAQAISNDPLAAALEAIPVPLIIINTYRQVVFCNPVFKPISKYSKRQNTIGLRPGEALGCIHADVNEGGCGTSLFCRDCGAAAAILRSLQGAAHTEECRLVRHTPDHDESLVLQVFTSPFEYHGNNLVIFTVIDISHEKRKKNLEHMFFHDILNLATGVKYASQMLCKVNTSERMDNQCRKIDRALTQMTEEIQAQKDLCKAEDGTLKINMRMTQSGDILTRIWDIYTGNPLCAERQISIAEDSEDFIFYTDQTIFARIMGNMVKNALEASNPGETITIGCRKKDKEVIFWGHNNAVMPDKIQRQMFKRAFSTKGEGRGMGTYSMKLLVEKYLGGKISFESTQEIGTVFSIALPMTEDQDKS
ncbi:HAMP domain-containing sensor histidine kinase [Maridesulfovibrio sp.]|uniref:sensor histidine kinase n=1 Tax=Maridesulfovibrio sp. TaxID=2795000 RepID=UPI0029CA890C|nr:HAMP domain-containing sensor histidine kinase [Maridesulfovibrio sp.]